MRKHGWQAYGGDYPIFGMVQDCSSIGAVSLIAKNDRRTAYSEVEYSV